MLRGLTTQSIKIFLEDLVGPKTGLLTTDFSGGNIFLYKPDGTKITVSLSAGTNYFEEDSTDSPGSYRFVISATDLDEEGYYTLSFQPAAAAFKAQLYKDYVSFVPLETATIDANVTSIVAVLPGTTIAAATDVSTSTSSIKGVDNRDLSVIAGAGFNATDSLVAIKAAIGTSPGAVWDELLTSHTTANSYGSMMQVLDAVIENRIKIDTVLKKMYLYDPTSTTIIKTYSLYDPTGAPTAVNVTERSKGI